MSTDIVLDLTVADSFAMINVSELERLKALFSKLVIIEAKAEAQGDGRKTRESTIMERAHFNNMGYIQLLLLTNITETTASTGEIIITEFAGLLGWRPLLCKVLETLFVFDMFIDSLADWFPTESFEVPSLFKSSNAFIGKTNVGKIMVNVVNSRVKLATLREWEVVTNCCDNTASCKHGVSRQEFVINCYLDSALMSTSCY